MEFDGTVTIKLDMTDVGLTALETFNVALRDLARMPGTIGARMWAVHGELCSVQPQMVPEGELRERWTKLRGQLTKRGHSRHGRLWIASARNASLTEIVDELWDLSQRLEDQLARDRLA